MKKGLVPFRCPERRFGIFIITEGHLINTKNRRNGEGGGGTTTRGATVAKLKFGGMYQDMFRGLCQEASRTETDDG